MKINFKKLNKNAEIPTLGSEYSAGLDLYAVCDGSTNIEIFPGETKKVGTGIAIEIPEGFFGGIFARSGLSTKKGLRPANCVGVIDSDYRGEIIVPLHNDSDIPRVINDRDRIAQLIILPYLQVEPLEVENLSMTHRDVGGFGSTGN